MGRHGQGSGDSRRLGHGMSKGIIETDGGIHGRPKRAESRSEAKRKEQIRLGDEKLIAAPIAEDFVNGSFFGPWALSQARTSILRGDSYDIAAGNAASSWVMTLAGRVTIQGTLGVGQFTSVPLVALISMGTGGIQQFVEIDAWRGAIQLPANVIKVTLVYQQLANQAPLSVGHGPTRYPDQVAVIGTLHRTFSANVGAALRSYWMNIDVGSTARCPVPPFATEWTYICNREIPAGPGEVTGLVVSTQPNVSGGMVLDIISAPVLSSMSRMHCFRPLPPGASAVQIANVAGNSKGGQVIFRIGL